MAENRLNINEADEAQLIDWLGIDPKLAQRLVEYRQANGRFATLSDLTAVDGISAEVVNEWGPRLTIEPTAVAPTLSIPATDPILPPPPAPVGPPSTRGNWLGSIALVLFAAILGSTLTLSILYGFNNSLHYAPYNSTERQQLQLQSTLQTVQQTQTAVQGAIDVLDQWAATAEASQGQTAVDLSQLQTDLKTANSTAVQLQTDLTDLGSQIEDVGQAAADFDHFLTGLRQLLLPTSEPSPTAVPSEATVEPSSTPTAVASPTSTASSPATRTPHPTATAIGQPSVTPKP